MIRTLTLHVQNRESVVFHGEVLSVTGYNDKGIFDVLPLHTQFISLISQKLVVRRKEGGNLEIPIQNGVMRVKNNNIEVYLGIKNKV